MGLKILCMEQFGLGTQYSFKINNKPIWYSYHHSDRGWFRLFGYGLSWKHKSVGLSFSERNGYTKYWRIYHWYFKILKKC